MKIVIADTSCIILYAKIERLSILQDTFKEIYITEEVAKELTDVPKWIQIRPLQDRNLYLNLLEQLDDGEASSIALASTIEDSLLIIDEKKGRKVAQNLNLEILGSLGIILKAKQKGVINSVKEILLLVEQTNFRVSNRIKRHILEEANELVD